MARERAADLADLADVALPKRPRKSEEWLRRLCVELFRENGVLAEEGVPSLRAFDDATVKDPGRGSLWRLHYAVRLRGADGQPFDLLGAASSLKRAGAVGSWAAAVEVEGGEPVAGRLCAIRKAARLAVEKLRRSASRLQRHPRPETLEHAKHVIVFATFPEADFSAAAVLRWYRLRRQVELVFKRFKSLAGLDCLPKHDPTSARARLYGKLLVALLTEKTLRRASAVSP